LGVHATIIGLAFGLTTPAYALLPPNQFPVVATRPVDPVVHRNEPGVVTADEHGTNDHTSCEKSGGQGVDPHRIAAERLWK
jgi:hypothetical protein